MIKVIYIISNINKAIAFEWIADYLPNGYISLSFILLNRNESELEKYLSEKRISYDSIFFNGRKSEYPIIFIKVLTILRRESPDVVHCHMFDASMIGLTAAKFLGIPRRIFTRHSGSYNWYYNKKGLTYDRYMAFLATDIVAISKNVKQLLLQEGVPSVKIKLLHHGFDLAGFENVAQKRIERLRGEYNPRGAKPVVGVISRLLHLKGIQYIIPAFRKLLKDYPNALLILANASGPYKPEIERLLKTLPEKSYHVVTFEHDIFALYQIFDIYVHTPISPTIEAFGQTYVEALAAGIPSVFTLSGVASEFINHEKNALVVDFENEIDIYNSMVRLLSDHDLSKRLIQNGKLDIQGFNLDHMIGRLEKLYHTSD